MEIVIEIDRTTYEDIVNNLYTDVIEIEMAIHNGIPLPEHHGRLIDLDEVRYRYINIIKVSNSELENLRMLAEILDTSPTIIEGSDTE